MLRALILLKANPSADFRSAFARATGMLASESRENPVKTYTVAEISDLFNYLYDLMQGKENEPAGGNRTGSGS